VAKKYEPKGDPEMPKRLVFIGSVDKHGQEMKNKHESNNNRHNKGEINGRDVRDITPNKVSTSKQIP